MLSLCQCEPRETPLVFDVVWSDHVWLTPARRSVIQQALDQWAGVVADHIPPLDRTNYVVVGNRGQVIDDRPSPVPADTLRVYVGVGPMTNPGALAEAGAVGYSAQGGFLERSPGGHITFDPTRTTDAVLPAVALHEAGHVIGMDHQPTSTPVEWRSVMYPYLDPARTVLTGREARDLLWSGHEIAPGTVITGVGTTPGGWAIYKPNLGVK